MRVAGAIVGAALALGACAQPARNAERDWSTCAGVAESSARVAACSAVAADGAQPVGRRAEALVNRGALRAAADEHARAMADFGRALRLDPNNARAVFERGKVHHLRGDFARALADFDAAVSIDPRITGVQQQRDAAEDAAEAAAARRANTRP